MWDYKRSLLESDNEAKLKLKWNYEYCVWLAGKHEQEDISWNSVDCGII